MRFFPASANCTINVLEVQWSLSLYCCWILDLKGGYYPGMIRCCKTNYVSTRLAEWTTAVDDSNIYCHLYFFKRCILSVFELLHGRLVISTPIFLSKFWFISEDFLILLVDTFKFHSLLFASRKHAYCRSASSFWNNTRNILWRTTIVCGKYIMLS